MGIDSKERITRGWSEFAGQGLSTNPSGNEKNNISENKKGQTYHNSEIP